MGKRAAGYPMNEFGQLVNAMLVMVFAAVMIVTGHLFLEKGAQKMLTIPAAQMVWMKTSPL